MLLRRRETMAISFKGAHFPPEIILMGVRWYVAYPLSTRHVEELMLERRVHVDHSTVNRWVIKYSPLLEEAFHRRKRPVWVSWRMDETYNEASPQQAAGYQTEGHCRGDTTVSPPSSLCKVTSEQAPRNLLIEVAQVECILDCMI